MARDAADMMKARAVGSLVVLKDGEPVGIVTDRDLLERIIADGKDAGATAIADVMSNPLHVASPEDPLERVVELMSASGIRRVPVVRGGALVGIVALDDVLVEVAEELHDLAEGMRRELTVAQRSARARELARDVAERVRELGEQLEHLGSEAKHGLLRELDGLRERVRRRRGRRGLTGPTKRLAGAPGDRGGSPFPAFRTPIPPVHREGVRRHDGASGQPSRRRSSAVDSIRVPSFAHSRSSVSRSQLASCLEARCSRKRRSWKGAMSSFGCRKRASPDRWREASPRRGPKGRMPHLDGGGNEALDAALVFARRELRARRLHPPDCSLRRGHRLNRLRLGVSMSTRARKRPAAAEETTSRHAKVIFDRVSACLDGSELSERVIPHALAIALSLGAPLTLLRVVESKAPGEEPQDPLEWDLRRRESRDYVARLAGERDGVEIPVESEVIEGQAAEEICQWTRQHGVGLTVLCTHGARGETEWCLASTARKLVEGVPGSVLLVPAAAPPQARVARYRRVLVPVDGSPRAESVIPLATRIAASQNAELVLAHVVPVPELIETGPLDSETLELRERLVRRNERVANEYLDRLRAQLAGGEVPVRALVLLGGDARGRVARLIAEEAVDLVILSAHGRSARADVSLGSVAAHLVAHAEVPLLIVRRRPAATMRRAARTEREPARLPSQATP
jgi:nucleotide-binding universal stress UspA family protein